jgi:hypothetical protein
MFEASLSYVGRSQKYTELKKYDNSDPAALHQERGDGKWVTLVSRGHRQ